MLNSISRSHATTISTVVCFNLPYVVGHFITTESSVQGQQQPESQSDHAFFGIALKLIGEGLPVEH
jgi:hypothetical protein